MTHDEAEDIKRHFNVIAEGLRSDIRLVAEGHEALLAEMGTLRAEMVAGDEALHSDIHLLAEGQRDLRKELGEFKGDMGEFKRDMGEFKREMGEFKGEMGEFKGEMSQFRAEVQGEFRDVRALIRLSYTELRRSRQTRRA